jgi:DNA primase
LALNSHTISEELIRRIREQVDIVEVVSQHLSLKRTGQNYTGLCPFHQEKTASFVVSPTRQIFHCFGCGAGGNVYHFLMRIEGCTFPQAVRVLGERAGIRTPTARRSPPSPEAEKELAQLYDLNQAAAHWYHQNLQRPEARVARRYLADRGMQTEAIEGFYLGYALPAWDELMKRMAEMGWAPTLLEKAGLVSAREQQTGFYDRFRDRIIFPIRNLSGQIMGFGGRALNDTLPKYLNSPETPIYIKGRSLYAMEKARQEAGRTGRVIVVEGYFDAIALHQAGIQHVVATLGTALTPFHLQIIRRFARQVVLIFDPDQAGINATLRTVDLFLESGMTATVVSLPGGQDPDSFVRTHGSEAFLRVVHQAKNLMDFALEQFIAQTGTSGIDQKLRVAEQILPLLNKMKNRMEQSHYLRRLSDELQVSEADLAHELKKFSEKGPRLGSVMGTVQSATGLPPAPKEEEVLLHLLLHGKLSLERIAGALGPEDFSDARLKRIIRLTLDRFQNPLSQEALLHLIHSDFLPPEDAALLSELSLRSLGYDDSDRTGEDCIRVIKQKAQQRLLNAIQRRIKAAEEQGDAVQVKVLQAELLGLRQRPLHEKIPGTV